MPIYEYECGDCHNQISLWFSSIAQAETQTPLCSVCASTNLTRLLSRFAVRRAGPAGPAPAAPAAGPGSPGSNDAQALAQAMRSASAGRDMGQGFQEVATRLEKGESATAVETTLRKRVGETMDVH